MALTAHLVKKSETRNYIESLLKDIAVLAYNEGRGSVRTEDEFEYWKGMRLVNELVCMAIAGEKHLPRHLIDDDSICDLFSKLCSMVEQLNKAGV